MQFLLKDRVSKEAINRDKWINNPHLSGCGGRGGGVGPMLAHGPQTEFEVFLSSSFSVCYKDH